jgi:hypothetical protein
MNWKDFFGNLADAGDDFNAHPALPIPRESVDRQPLPFLPDVLGICHECNRQIWGSAWKLAGDKADP